MSVATLRELREELATAVSTVVHCYDTLPAAPEPPFAVVMWPDSIEFARVLSGKAEYEIAVTVYVSLSDVTAGQIQLDDYIAPIRAAVHGHTTSVWASATVETATNFRPEDLGDAKCLAVDLNITAIA